MSTYTQAMKKRGKTMRKKLGVQGYSEHMRKIANKRWKQCECGHPYDVHDGACCADTCQCGVFRGVVKNLVHSVDN